MVIQSSDYITTVVFFTLTEHGSLHPLDCESTTRDTTTSTYNPISILNSTSSIIRQKTGPTFGFTSSYGSTSMKQSSSQSQSVSSITGYTSRKQISSSITGYTSSSTVHYDSQSQNSSGITGYTSSSTIPYDSQSQDSSSNIGYKSSITVHYSSQGQGPGYSSLQLEQQKKDVPSNTLAVGLGIGLGILALLGTLITLLYRYFSEKNKVSDFTGIYGFPPETPRQSDRSGKSTFRQNMA
ncbi:hypothetical protein ACJMK2_028478 [Sinanodonta woodiana]|uniref:Uncharacterized protein n=1 Tax=Sinanodonta woodiana TaxID=1069815 RepID=A0ABD3X793_SINWO